MPTPTFKRGEIVKVKHAGTAEFYKKLRGDEWANVRTLTVYSEKDLKHELAKAEKASAATVAAFKDTHKLDSVLKSNEHMAVGSSVASQDEIARLKSDYQLNAQNILNKNFTTKDLKNTWILDVESGYTGSRAPVATAGIYNPNGKSIPGFNSNKAEVFFLDSLADSVTPQANTAEIGYAGIDTVEGHTVKYVSRNVLHLVENELKKTPDAEVKYNSERLHNFVREMSGLLTDSKKSDNEIVGSVAGKLKKYKDDIQALIDNRGEGDLLAGEADKDGRVFAITGKTTEEFLRKTVDAELEGKPGKVNLFNFNGNFDARQLRAESLIKEGKFSVTDMKGAFSVMFDGMFKHSGLKNTNAFGTTFGSLVKKLNLTDRQSTEIFNRMAYGWDSTYSKGFSLENVGELVDYVLGYGKRKQQHEALDDTVQAELTFNRTKELFHILQDEQTNKPGGAHTKYRKLGMSMRRRTMLGMFRVSAAEVLPDSDFGLGGPKSRDQVLESVDAVIKKDSNYRAMANRIESSAGHAVNKSLFGSVAEAVGSHSVNNILAGAALFGGVRYVVEKAHDWMHEHDEDKNRIDGMPHTSFLTMARRISMTDFRSGAAKGGLSSAGGHPIEDTGDLFTSVTRTFKHLFKNAQDVIMERAGKSSSAPTTNLIGTMLKLHNTRYGIRGTFKEAAKNVGRSLFYTTTKTMLNTNFGRRNFNVTDEFVEGRLKDVATHDGARAVLRTLKDKIVKKDVSKSVVSHFASKAARKVSGIFLTAEHKLTPIGVFTAVGFGLGLAINALKGSSDTSYNYSKYYNNDKVRNDPRFEDRKHNRSFVRLVDQVRSSKQTSGIRVQSAKRQQNRYALTDFGSGIGARFMGKMLGEVKGMKLLRFLDNQLITRIPEVQKEQLTRTTKSVVTKLKEDLKVLINKPSLNKATKVAEREVDSFVGAKDTTRSIVDKVEKSAAEGIKGADIEVTKNRAYKNMVPEGTSVANNNVIKESRLVGATEAAKEVELQETRDAISNDNANKTLVGRMKDIVTPSHKQHLPDKAILDITDPPRKSTNIPRTNKMRGMKYAPILEARTGENVSVARTEVINEAEMHTAEKVANAPTASVTKPDVRYIETPKSNGRVNRKGIIRTNPKPVYNASKPRAIEPDLEKYDIKGATRNKENLRFTVDNKNTSTYRDVTQGKDAGYATSGAVAKSKYQTPYVNTNKRGVRYSHETYNKNVISKRNGPGKAERQLSDWMTDPRSSTPAHRYAYHTTSDFNRLPSYAY